MENKKLDEIIHKLKPLENLEKSNKENISKLANTITKTNETSVIKPLDSNEFRNRLEDLNRSVGVSTEENMKNISDSVVNAVDKSSNGIVDFISKSVSFISNFIERVKEKLSESFNFIVDQFTSTVSYVLGPIYDYLKQGFNLVVGSFAKIKGMFTKDKDDSSSWLQKIFGFLKKKEKKDFAKGLDKPKKFDITKILGLVVGGLGVVIGGLIGAIVKPFEVLYKAMKPLKVIFVGIGNLAKSLFGFVKKIPKIGKMFSFIGKMFSGIGRFFQPVIDFGKRIISFFSGLQKSSGLIGTFAKGVAKGFAKLAWPLNILLGLFDFVKGFTSTEGSLIDKFKAGLISAVTGFLDLPLKVIGWVTDKFLGLFGIKVEGGTGNKLIEWLGKGIGMIIDGWTMIFQGLYDSVVWLIDIFKNTEIGDGVIGLIKEGVFLAIDYILAPFKILWEGIKGLYNIFTGDYDSAFDNLKNIGSIIFDWFKNLGTFIWDIIQNVFSIDMEFGDLVSGLTDWFSDWFGSIGEWVSDKVKNLASKLNPFNWFGGDDEDEEKPKPKSKPKKHIKVRDLMMKNDKIRKSYEVDSINNTKDESLKHIREMRRKEREDRKRGLENSQQANTKLEDIKNGNNKIANNQNTIINNNNTQSKQEVKKIPDESGAFGMLVTNKATGW